MASSKKRIRTGQLNTLAEPNFVSVVKTPANRSGFKVIREDSNSALSNLVKESQSSTKTKRKDSELLSIDLPAGVTRDTAEEILQTYALQEDYEIVESNGAFSLRRSGAEASSLENTTSISLGDGVFARIERSDVKKSKTPGVQLVRLDFSGDGYRSVDSVKDWLAENEIDFADGGVAKTDSGFSVTRIDVMNDAKEINLSDGIIAQVVRSEETDVPEKVYRNVVEAAYGNYGWGHLSFACSLADPAFTDNSWDALWALRDVLENVVIYSGLPLDERKRLMHGALDQYADYMDLVIDALPTTVLELSRSGIEKTKREDSPMSKKDEVKPADDVGTDVTANGDSKDMVSISRGDLDTLAKDAAASAVASALESQKRAEEDGSDSDESTDGDSSTEIAALTKTVGDLADSVKAMRSDVDEMSETTDSRRNDDDGDEEQGDQPKSIFGGILG